MCVCVCVRVREVISNILLFNYTDGGIHLGAVLGTGILLPGNIRNPSSCFRNPSSCFRMDLSCVFFLLYQLAYMSYQNILVLYQLLPLIRVLFDDEGRGAIPQIAHRECYLSHRAAGHGSGSTPSTMLPLPLTSGMLGSLESRSIPRRSRFDLLSSSWESFRQRVGNSCRQLGGN